MFFQAPSSNVQRGPNHYSRSWPHLVLSSLWECSSKPRISYRQGLGPSQLPLRHIHSLYTPISRIHSPCCAHTAAAPPEERDERATPHSTTSSASASSVGGMSRPSLRGRIPPNFLSS